jgi:hypothetical protein
MLLLFGGKLQFMSLAVGRRMPPHPALSPSLGERERVRGY